MNLRICFLPIAVCAIAQNLAGQTALTTREVTTAKTCLANTEAHSASLDANPNAVLAVVAGTLSTDELAQFQKEAAAFYQALKNKPAMRLCGLPGPPPLLFNAGAGAQGFVDAELNLFVTTIDFHRR